VISGAELDVAIDQFGYDLRLRLAPKRNLSIHCYISKVLLAFGRSRATLAAELGCETSLIDAIEHGRKPPEDLLRRLCARFLAPQIYRAIWALSSPRAQAMARRRGGGLVPADIVEAAHDALSSAILKHRPEQGDFFGYLRWWIHGEVNKRRRPEVPVDWLADHATGGPTAVTR